LSIKKYLLVGGIDMGFFKTSLAVTTGILGAVGLIALGQHLSENGALDKVKERVSKAAVTGKDNKKADETAATN
jgi:hypothetical protein